MKRATAQALVASIFKHRKNLEANFPWEVSLGNAVCPLCIFVSRHCYMCPIHEVTGRGACEGTPYKSVADAWREWRDGPTYPDDARSAFIAAELHMIEFMQSLLPRNLADNLED